MALVVVRVLAILLAVALATLAVRYHERALSFFRRFWLEPSSPVNVAIWRIALFALILRSAQSTRPLWYASFPASAREPPWGWAWLGALPFDERLVSGAQDALIVSAAAATLGLGTRVSAPVAALLAVYVLGLPNFFAKVNHGNTARVLCALAVAFAPCGDALSLDALIKRLRGHAPPAPSAAYTIPVRAAWVLVGTTYFFPGFWKLWQAGDLWVSGQALAYQITRRWALLPDFEPAFRVDQHPILLALLGVGTLVFEIGFVFALLNRFSRTIAAVSAAVFHLAIAHFMKIHFNPFFPLLVLVEVPERWDDLRRRLPTAALEAISKWRERFVRWLGAIARRPGPAVASKARPFASAWPAILVGGALISGQIVAGFARVHSWPVTVYPTFAQRKAEPLATGKRQRVALESKGNPPVDLHEELDVLGSARLRRLMHGALEKTRQGPADDRTLLEVFRHAGVHVETGDRLVVYEASWRVLPPGKRSGYREKEVARYRVTREGTLVVVR